MELDFSVELKAATDSLDSMDQKLSRMQRRWFPRRIPSTVTAAGAGTSVIDFGSPAQGKLWNPVAIAIFGAPPTFAMAALTRVAFTIGDLNNSTPGQVVAILEGVNLEQFSETFGTEALWAYTTENCFAQCVVTGATTLFATLQVREYNQDDIEPRFA